jgi:hypothetical protein
MRSSVAISVAKLLVDEQILKESVLLQGMVP